MFISGKNIIKLLTLLLVAVLATTICFSTAGAEAYAGNIDPSVGRDIVPEGNMTVEMVKTVDLGTAKKYSIYLYYGANVDISMFELSTITVSGTTVGGANFSLTKNNISKTVTVQTGNCVLLGYVSLTSNVASASATSATARMKRVSPAVWFNVAALNNASVTIS